MTEMLPPMDTGAAATVMVPPICPPQDGWLGMPFGATEIA
jgi:hypothetical protein